MNPLLAYLEGHFAFHHVEPFLLIQVQVKRRPAWEEMGVLHDEQAARGFGGGYLEENGAEPQGVGMGGTVLAGTDHVYRGWEGRCGSLGMRPSDKKIFWERRRDGNSLEERTPFHGGS
jgi:hypothetical protein